MITPKSLQGLPDELFKASLKQETSIRRYVASLQRKEILDLMMNLTVALKDSTEEDLPSTKRQVAMSIYLLCLEREWENGSTFEMETQVEVWLKDVKAPQTDVYRFANRLAWITRWDRTPPPLAGPLEISSDTDNSLHVSFVGRLYLNRARFAFTTNDSFVSSVENYEKKSAHPFILANRGFGEILAGRVRGVSSYLDDAWERRAEDNEIVDICLHALWLAADNAEMATKLSNWCEQAFDAGYANSVIYYRHARALRELEDFDLALIKINEAIRLNTGTGEFFATFSEELLREQQMIIMQRDFAAKLAIINSSLESVSKVEARVESFAQSSIVRSVEIVGIFSGIIAFIISSVQVSSHVSGIVRPLMVLGAEGLILLGFIVLLVFIIGRARKSSSAS